MDSDDDQILSLTPGAQGKKKDAKGKGKGKDTTKGKGSKKGGKDGKQQDQDLDDDALLAAAMADTALVSSSSSSAPSAASQSGGASAEEDLEPGTAGSARKDWLLPPANAGSNALGFRGIKGELDSYRKRCPEQTVPPSVPVSRLFSAERPANPGSADGLPFTSPEGIFSSGQRSIFPIGEETPYPSRPDKGAQDFRTSRTTAEEKRADARSPGFAAALQHAREAAEVHRQTRKYAQSIIKPGLSLSTFCEALENENRRLVGENGPQERGVAFPTGVSVNSCAAHWTPNPESAGAGSGADAVFREDSVVKIDFGTQVSGRIVDCAFSVAFDSTFDPLLAAVKEATEAGIRAAGVDARLGEIGGIIEEVLSSAELSLDGDRRTFPIKAIRNLSGHSIEPWKIHGGKSVPIVKSGDPTRMEEGEFYAVEVFASSGRGDVIEEEDWAQCSHFMLDFDRCSTPAAYQAALGSLRLDSSKKLLAHIKKTFGTLAFCRRWLERPDGGSFTINGNKGKQERYSSALKNLVDAGICASYPPLVDKPSPGQRSNEVFTAQYEHTLVLRPECKEVLTRGDDY